MRTRWYPFGLVPLAAALFGSAPAPAEAQGCICARQTLPIFGAQRSPYLQKGEWQASFTYRFNRSDTLYSGSDEAPDAPEVERVQHLFDVQTSYGLTRQLALTLSVPFADMRFGLGLPMGTDPDVAHTSGLGDITLTGRYWLLDTHKHEDGNIALGLGVKFPTGNYNAQDSFRNPAGQRAVRYMDISSQPGDGGFGAILDLQAFKRFGDVTGFASANYLINPRDTNGTPSLPFALEGPGGPPNALVNSVPDQYIARLGAAVPIKPLKGLSFSLAGRVEGVPPSDLFGDSNGFRFAGYAVFVEPGLTYTTGNHTFAVQVPVTVGKKIQNIDTTPGPDMGTIVPYSVIFTYSHRFGR